VYGAEAAARNYFGTSASSLTEREAAQLAASLPRPSRWHPGVDSPSYLHYVEDILARMARADFLWRHIGAEPPVP
jgi:monofunctional biosynthetic peptidoglycan transglycosylase